MTTAVWSWGRPSKFVLLGLCHFLFGFGQLTVGIPSHHFFCLSNNTPHAKNCIPDKFRLCKNVLFPILLVGKPHCRCQRKTHKSSVIALWRTAWALPTIYCVGCPSCRRTQYDSHLNGKSKWAVPSSVIYPARGYWTLHWLWARPCTLVFLSHCLMDDVWSRVCCAVLVDKQWRKLNVTPLPREE